MRTGTVVEYGVMVEKRVQIKRFFLKKKINNFCPQFSNNRMNTIKKKKKRNTNKLTASGRYLQDISKVIRFERLKIISFVNETDFLKIHCLLDRHRIDIIIHDLYLND